MRALVASSLLALTALAALSAAPVASASGCLGDVCIVGFCDRDPCIAQGATVGSGGVDAFATVYVFDGAGVGAHAGTDGVYVGYGVGITNCTYGVDVENGEPVARCVF